MIFLKGYHIGFKKIVPEGTLGYATMPEMTSKWPHSAQIYLSRFQMTFDYKNKIFFLFISTEKTEFVPK